MIIGPMPVDRKLSGPAGKSSRSGSHLILNFTNICRLEIPSETHGQTRYPMSNKYSQRDFGNRVGHIRLMELLDKYNLRGSVSLNVALCDHHPEIIEDCVKRDWEFFSHGIYCLLYTSPSPRDQRGSRMPSSA